jgi:tRNA nucleotidyltransferase (CCA-adding enzyme)
MSGPRAATSPEELANLDALERHVERVLRAQGALSLRDLAVDGNDLMQELGIGPGPELGHLLRALLELVTDDPSANQRDVLLARARALHDASRDS